MLLDATDVLGGDSTLKVLSTKLAQVTNYFSLCWLGIFLQLDFEVCLVSQLLWHLVRFTTTEVSSLEGEQNDCIQT